jgi:hypothetical protein
MGCQRLLLGLWRAEADKPASRATGLPALEVAAGLTATLRGDPIEHGYIVRNANGHALAYVYFEDEPDWRSAAKMLTRHVARRVAVNIAKLPDLLGKPAK